MGIAVVVFIPFIVAVVQIGMALVAGIKIWRLSGHQIGPRRTTVRLLAFNLLEPTVNTVLVGLVLVFGVRTFWASNFMTWDGLPYAAAITLPMALLLLPFVWATSPDPVARGVNIKLGILGLARWAITAITLVVPYAMVLGLIVLGWSLHWVNRQAYQTIGVYYQAVGVGPEGVMVGELHDFKLGNQPDVRI